MNNHTIRKSIITGVVVLSIFAIASVGMDKKSEEVAYYPIEQTSNVFAAFDSNIETEVDGEDSLEIVENDQDEVNSEDEILSDEKDVLGSYDTLLQSLVPGSSDPMVYVIEFELRERGFFTLTPDMTFGYKTLEAIQAFQNSLGIPSTGRLDSSTLSKLLLK